MASVSSCNLEYGVFGVCYDTFTFSRKLFHTFTLRCSQLKSCSSKEHLLDLFFGKQ